MDDVTDQEKGQDSEQDEDMRREEEHAEREAARLHIN